MKSDLDKPMKPIAVIKYPIYTIGSCPTCKMIVFKGDEKCHKCGQLLEWNNVEIEHER